MIVSQRDWVRPNFGSSGEAGGALNTELQFQVFLYSPPLTSPIPHKTFVDIFLQFRFHITALLSNSLCGILFCFLGKLDKIMTSFFSDHVIFTFHFQEDILPSGAILLR